MHLLFNFVEFYQFNHHISLITIIDKYNKKTNEMAIIKDNGVVITYYKPKDGYNYYLKQKKEKDKYGKR